MEFTIHTQETVKQLNNFWSHIHFHPTDAIEDDWGRRILDQVAEDQVAETVRMYAMLEDIVSLAADGSLQYDFTLADTRLDYMISKGFRILLSYNFTPPCIAVDPQESSAHAKNKTRYKGKMIVTSPPRDYGLWEEICRAFTAHVVARYGAERVSNWYLQCFNEPDLPSFFFRTEADQILRAREYYKLYQGFEKGILSVCPELTIGGPALAGNYSFMEEFLRLIREGGNRLDYICVHTYGADPLHIDSGEKPLNIRNSLGKIRHLQKMAADYGFGHLPFIIDEWGAASRGFNNMKQVPSLVFRESEVFSAYYARMFSLYEELELGIEKMMICLSGQHEMESDFTGFRGFFTLNGFPKPIYNGYRLAAKLGSRKLACSCPYMGETYALLPTAGEDGRIAALYTYAQDTLVPLEAEEVTVRLQGAAGEYEARLWQVDGETANGYRAFEKLGSPEELTREQIGWLAEKAKCKPLSLGRVKPGEAIRFTARSNSVNLMEWIPVK